MAMMFEGAYTDEFYRGLHDALHVQVDAWHSTRNPRASTKQSRELSAPRLDEVWARVVHLEKICRNPQPTVLDAFSSRSLVQLRPAPDFAHVSPSDHTSGSD